MKKKAEEVGGVALPPRRRGRPTLSDLQNRADTREFLLQAASAVMIEKNNADVSLSEIAEKTNLSAALVQYHFGSKGGLLIALLERDGAKAVQQLDALAEMDLPVVQKLRLHIGGLVNAYFQAPYMNSLVNRLLGEQGGRDNPVLELLAKPIAEFQRTLLEQGQRDGLFRPITPMEFYFIVVGACDHFFARREALSNLFGITTVTEEMKRSYARTVTQMVLNGISTSAAYQDRA